ncbi:Peptidase M16 inactive domain family [Synechococcus sp. PCC 7335]|uniref:M16 family metallopeptidase n=1 Tax=Synechococcus sp. (strain ATCC 29403 / PCC 7335) TaxID=91464 RepID=UPI00017EC7DF|nr:pitrilysin family protein [Synechococcus sp. PCC 7335]EDX86354.1 Peptidase M16 inactive domain family [Synechococcus sp. PCC 7335]
MGFWVQRRTVWLRLVAIALIVGFSFSTSPSPALASSFNLNVAPYVAPSITYQGARTNTHPIAQSGVIAQANVSTNSIQPYLDRVADAVTEFTLPNGMKFIVLEQHDAPVASVMLYANVGASYEEDGKTGVAHYLEHLAFKGTTRIGTRDYAAERVVLDQLDNVFDQLIAAEAAGEAERVSELTEQFAQLQQEAATYVEQNKFGQIIEQSGGTGLNATTSADATRYFYNLPSNKIELWFSLESERFLDPVFREFYKEKEVILEERRSRVDNSPIGQMVERFSEVAYSESPYRRPVIGYQEDLRKATRADVRAFFNTYYGPSNLIAAVVGDVDPEQIKQLADAYFGRFESRVEPPELVANEPEQIEPRSFTLQLASQPWYLEGYHRPGINDPDHVVYAIINSILTGGRTARLYKALVEPQIALDVGSANGFPGDKLSSIMLLYGLTAPNHTVEELAAGLDAELLRLQQEPVDTMTLDRVKTQARAGLLRQLDSNQGMASLLTEYEAKTGDWRNVFRELQLIEAVEASDVQRVARQTFRLENRTVGKLIPAEEAAPQSSTSSETSTPELTPETETSGLEDDEAASEVAEEASAEDTATRSATAPVAPVRGLW